MESRCFYDTGLKYFFRQNLILKDLSKPDQILSHLDELLEETLRYKEGGDTSFGLDCVLFVSRNIIFALCWLRPILSKIDEEVIEIKGDKKSLG